MSSSAKRDEASDEDYKLSAIGSPAPELTNAKIESVYNSDYEKALASTKLDPWSSRALKVGLGCR